MTGIRALVVDDEEGMLELLVDTLSEIAELKVVPEADATRAAERLEEEDFELLITDIRMPKLAGTELLRIAVEKDPEMPVIMLTAYPSIDTAVQSMKLGATDYVTKPFLPDDLLATVRRVLESNRLRLENRLLHRQVARDYSFDDLIGRSSAMREVFDTIQRVAVTDVDVLIVGETGTGKELVARSIHKRSQRSQRSFVPIDCGAIPENLLESELFGHERGAFTGAEGRSLGLLELAEGGTFFLDEIGELSPQLQVKLLRVLQERRFRRVGGREEIPVDVRVLAATNRDLAKEVGEGRFREDLYYRVNVVQVHLPPLRDRRDDLPLLIRHFVGKYAREMGKGEIMVAPEVLDTVAQYSWPGNVRELQNVIKRVVALTRTDCLMIDDLPDEIVLQSGASSTPESGGFFAARTRHVTAFEREYLDSLLRQFQGDVAAAARDAQVPRGTLYRLLKKHGLTPESYRSS